MDAAKAEVAFKQGDFELGSKLMNMSQDRKLKAAELAAQTAYREAMVKLQGTQLTEQERHNRAMEAAKNAEIGVMRDYRMAMIGGKNTFTEAQQSAARGRAGTALEKALSTQLSPESKLLRSGVSKQDLLDAYTSFHLTGEPLKLPSLQASQAPGEVVGKLKLPNS